MVLGFFFSCFPLFSRFGVGMDSLNDLVEKQAARIETLEAQVLELMSCLALTTGRLNVLWLRQVDQDSVGAGGVHASVALDVLHREATAQYEAVLNQIQDKGLRSAIDAWRPLDLGD